MNQAERARRRSRGSGRLDPRTSALSHLCRGPERNSSFRTCCRKIAPGLIVTFHPDRSGAGAEPQTLDRIDAGREQPSRTRASAEVTGRATSARHEVVEHDHRDQRQQEDHSDLLDQTNLVLRAGAAPSITTLTVAPSSARIGRC
jgi:hypothetical protein